MVAFIRQCQYNSDMAPDRMQLQKVCKKRGTDLSKNTPKDGEPGSPSVSLNDEERNDNNDSRHVTSVLL